MAFNRDPAMMSSNDGSYDAQAKAAAAALTRHSRVHLVEALENALHFASGQADAVVLDREKHPAVPDAGREGDVLVVARILVGIVKQVDQGGDHRIRICPNARDIGRGLDVEPATGSADPFADCGSTRVENLAGRQLLQIKRV